MEEKLEKSLSSARTLAKKLHSIGAKKVELLNISCKTQDYTYMILSSSTTQDGTKLLLREILLSAEKLSLTPLSIEGQYKGDWIIVEFDDFVLHILTDSSRKKFNLDKLWKTPRNQIKFNK